MVMTGELTSKILLVREQANASSAWLPPERTCLDASADLYLR